MPRSRNARVDTAAPPAPPPDDPLPTARRRGIQSIEVGGQLLQALAHHGRPMALKDLAREAGMGAARAHPYLVSFGQIGLIEQDPVTGRYGLGPLALELGLISLQQSDPVRLATHEAPGLAIALGLTIALVVWGSRGPTVVRVEAPPAALHVSVHPGTVVSVPGTASGRVFAAFLPAGRRPDQDDAALSLSVEDLADVRRAGLAYVRDGVTPGLAALSVPVFDHRPTLVLALTAIGPSPLLDGSRTPQIGHALQQAARALSRRLGADWDRAVQEAAHPPGPSPVGPA